MTLRSHSDLRVGDIVAVCDTREQAPLDLLIPTITGTLKTGDYSVRGLEHLVAVERKSLADLLVCVGRERERFDACIQRMRGYEVRVLVVEAGWGAIELGQWRSKLRPSQVKAALYSWMKHVSVVCVPERQTAAAIVSGILFSAARERWRQLQSFYSTLKLSPSEQAKENALLVSGD